MSPLRPTCLLSLILLALLATGCVQPSPRVRTWVDPQIVNNMPKRIIVVPFHARNCRLQERAMLTRVFADELQDLMLSEIVVAPESDARLCGENGLSARPVIDVEALIDSRKRYRADAFLFSTVTRYRPYDPPALGLKLRMIDARSGSLLWAAETLMDATRHDVRLCAELYFWRSGLRDRGFGPELIFTVPQYYAQFVSAAIARDIKAKVAPPKKEKTGK